MKTIAIVVCVAIAALFLAQSAGVEIPTPRVGPRVPPAWLTAADLPTCASERAHREVERVLESIGGGVVYWLAAGTALPTLRTDTPEVNCSAYVSARSALMGGEHVTLYYQFKVTPDHHAIEVQAGWGDGANRIFTD